MFPLTDSTPREKFPFVNYLIIVVNIIVFIIELTTPNFDSFINQFAFIPAQFSFGDWHTYIPIFTSLFLHGGILHILSNMWFLRIFGDNVEDRMGHIPYLIFYLLAGLFATLGQYFFSAANVPILGASGAISGVAGAYFVWYRRSTVKTLVTFFLITIIDLPVSVFLGYWFFIQLFSGIGSVVTAQQGGVAFFAHVTGFIFGFIVAKSVKSSALEV